jgi:hypothetical protein
VKRIYPYKMVAAQDNKITCQKVGTGYKTTEDAMGFINALVRDQDKAKYLFFEFAEGKAPPTVTIDLNNK